MRRFRTTLIAAIAIGLLAGSAVGTAAQDSETEASGEFSATWHFNFDHPQIRESDSEGSDPVRTRGYANRPRAIETAGDPRFEGELTVVVDHDRYQSDGALQVFNRAFSVENDGGTWRGVPAPFLYFSDAAASGATQLFIGEDGYAGSYAIADIQSDTAGQVWTLRGIILEGEPPPAPEPFVSE